MNRPGPYDVTIVEGDEAYAGRLVEELERSPMPFLVHHFKGLEEATEHLLHGQTDVIVLDPPADGGLDALSNIRARFPEMPVVALADSPDDDFSSQVLRCGALDCVPKTDLAHGVLARVLISAIERQFAQNLLSDLSLIDPLTGLINRKGFFSLVEQRARLGRRSGKPMKILFIDIDGLQQINRTYGHGEGDRTLKAFAEAVKTVLRGADTLGRFGPDELVAAVEDCSDEEAAVILDRIRGQAEKLRAEEGRAYPFRVTAASASFNPEAPKQVLALVEEARETALAEMKQRPADQEQPVSARAARAKKKILLIDDDEGILQMLEKRLGASGYDVLKATDGREGLETARQGWPDLVVLDLRLPGYSGEEICKAIREDGDKEFARTPILMLTGKTSDVDRVVGMVIGASAYLTKPFRTQDLMRHVRKLAGRTEP